MTTKMKSQWWVHLLMLVVSAHVFAATLPPIVIYGEMGEELEAAGVTISPQSYRNRTVSLPEVLSDQVGVHLTRFGGLEEATSISIRGSDPDEVQVSLDGIPLNASDGRGVDLSLFSLEGLSSIRIYRGGGSLLSGQNATAMVELTSRSQGGFSSLSYGSYNTVKHHVNFSKSLKRFKFTLANSYSRTDGDFKFFDNNGTPLNTADDARVTRRNNSAQTIHPFIKLDYDFDERTRISTLIHYIRRDRGVPGLSSNQSQSSNLDTQETMMGVKLTRKKFFHPNLNFEDFLYTRLTKNQFSDLNAEIGLGPAQDNDDDTFFFGKRASLDWLIKNHSVSTSLNYQFERFKPTNFLVSPSQGGASLRHQIHLATSSTLDFWDHRLLTQPTVRFENVQNQINNDDPSSLTPATFINSKNHQEVSVQLGLQGRVYPGILLKSHGGRSHRFPTFPELFGDRGGVVGNPFLNPQETRFWDAGIQINPVGVKLFKGLQWGGNYFDRFVFDLIEFEQNSGFARAENVGRARIHGLETQFHVDFSKTISLATNYTFQRALDRTTGRNLPGRPEHEVNTKVAGSFKNLGAFFSMNWMDSNFLDPLNTQVIKDRVLLNTGLDYKIRRWIVAFEIKNLSDETTVDAVGFPLPGRSFFGKIQFEWEPKPPS